MYIIPQPTHKISHLFRLHTLSIKILDIPHIFFKRFANGKDVIFHEQYCHNAPS